MLDKIFKFCRLGYDKDRNVELTFTFDKSLEKELQMSMNTMSQALMGDKKLVLSVNTQKRSLDANAYAWILLNKLAKKLGTEKETLYIEIVKKVGSFEIIPIRTDVVDEWLRKWNCKGLGWVAETMGESKLKNYTNTINYFGSSVYNTKEMYILIEEIIYNCKQNDIETMTPDELAKLKGLCENE